MIIAAAPAAGGVCCFVLLVPTPRLALRVPRVSQGTPHPNCFRLLPSLAMPVPPSSLQTTPEVPVLLSEVQSGVLHLLGIILGAPRGQGDPHLVLGG